MNIVNIQTKKGDEEMTNQDKAIAVLKSLAENNTKPITDYVSEKDYIQHNLTFKEGRQTMLDALPVLKEAGTTIDIKRVITDGDYVALQSEYNLFGHKDGFDIFRFEDGKIVEHWDNLLAVAPPNPSGHTQFDGVTEIKDLDKTEANKKIVTSFVKDILVGENPSKLTSYFNGDKYIQHNPSIADGLSGLGEALGAMAKAGIQMIYSDVHMVIGQGNFVLVVSEGTFAGQPTSYYDLFRVENGKIAEHWDVIETITPEVERQNTDGKF